MQVWDRATKAIIETPTVGEGAMRFCYETAVGRFLTKAILCRKPISALYGAVQKSFFTKHKARKFMRQYGITAADCEKQEFSSFNDFFTRKRLPQPDTTQPNELPAVADCKLTALPIGRDSVFTVKGVRYTLPELLENDALAERFCGGWCLIFRLSPDDYHRYSYPDAGTQERTVHIPGVLHSVNPIAGSMGVYRRNSRCYTLLHTAHFGDVLEMEVGALLVGKILNHEEAAGTRFEKLQEKGYFAYGGSTVILLLEPGRVVLDEDILRYSAQGIESRVRTGERIGEAL